MRIAYFHSEIKMVGVIFMADLTLKQAYDLFIFDRQTFCLDKTVENYENTVRYFCDYIAGKRGCPQDEVKLSGITALDVKEYVVWLRQRPANMNHPFKESGGRLSKRTVRNYTKDLKTFYHFLEAEGYAADITGSVKVIKSEKRTVVPLSALEVQQVDALFNVRTAMGCRNYCIVHLMLDAGLRANEVCTLQAHDVNFDNKYLLVYGKGAKERTVPMSRNLRKYLYEYFYIHRQLVGSDCFFGGAGGNPLTDSCIKSLFARLRKRAGIARLKPHLLRHTFATCFVLGGGSVEMLRILLGHESISTTQIYMHLAAVYEFNEDPYELDPIFFNSYRNVSHRPPRPARIQRGSTRF